MFNRIHRKLGTAGFIISIVALVAALGGGAYAASAKLNSTQKKEVEKIAKKYAGKPDEKGATGPAGAAGAAGAKGDAGAAGANGTAGTAGTNGTNGTNGTSVTNTALAKGSTACAEGGAEFKVGTGTATHACNGLTGFTETLPAGKTETGVWSLTNSYVSPNVFVQLPISFSIPLAATGDEAFAFDAHDTAGEEFGASGCSGSVAHPTAPPGVLCVYTQFEVSENVENFGLVPQKVSEPTRGYETSGAFLNGYATEAEVTGENPARIEAGGTWAVTAPTAP